MRYRDALPVMIALPITVWMVVCSGCVPLDMNQMLARETAHRSPAPGPVAARVGELYDFQVPAQPASQTLLQLGGALGISITASAADLDGVRTNAVTGTLSLDQGLQRILAGTGLTYVRTQDGRTVAWRREHTPGNSGLTPSRSASGARGCTLIGPRRRQGSGGAASDEPMECVR